MKKIFKNKKGFTLAELLIVVAIIGVLVAVSIPIFTSQLKKARLATNQANARAAKAAAIATELTRDSSTTGTYPATYVYDIAQAKITDEKTLSGATAVDKADIFSMKETAFENDVASKWAITIEADGTVSAIAGLVQTGNGNG